MGSSLRQPNLLHAQSDSGPDRPGVGSNRPQSVVQHELEVGVAIEVRLALAAKPFSDGHGAFIALIDQQRMKRGFLGLMRIRQLIRPWSLRVDCLSLVPERRWLSRRSSMLLPMGSSTFARCLVQSACVASLKPRNAADNLGDFSGRGKFWPLRCR